jgi:hypothetical protein
MPSWARRTWEGFTDAAAGRGHVVVETADGQGFAMFGGWQARHQFTRVYLGGNSRATTRVRIHRRASVALAERLCKRYGLVVFCGGSAPRELRERLLSVPVLVDVERDTPTTFSGSVWSDGARTAIRRIAREGFTSDLADVSWAEEFHERLFRPSMSGRHGAEARVQSRRRTLWMARQADAEFVRVLHAGRPVAAYLNHRRGDYWFSMRRAASLGCRTVSFGACLPYLTDGVMRHKGQWGARLATGGPRHGEFQWLIDPSHPTCRQFLQQQAIIARDAHGRRVVLAGRPASEIDVPSSLLEGLGLWYVWRHASQHPESGVAEGLPSPLRPWLSAVRLTEGA